MSGQPVLIEILAQLTATSVGFGSFVGIYKNFHQSQIIWFQFQNISAQSAQKIVYY